MRIRVYDKNVREEDRVKTIENVRSAAQYDDGPHVYRVSYKLNSDSRDDSGLRFACGKLIDAEEE